jgi:hypothetical protein
MRSICSRFPIFLVAGLCCALSTTPALAQQAGAVQQGPSLVEYARPGMPTMTLYIWGAVALPGIWMVEEGQEVTSLLTAVTVPLIGSEEGIVRRETILRIYRGPESSRRTIFERDLNEFLAQGGTPPPLEDGDIIYVNTVTRQRLGIALVLGVISTLATLVLLGVTLAQ